MIQTRATSAWEFGSKWHQPALFAQGLAGDLDQGPYHTAWARVRAVNPAATLHDNFKKLDLRASSRYVEPLLVRSRGWSGGCVGPTCNWWAQSFTSARTARDTDPKRPSTSGSSCRWKPIVLVPLAVLADVKPSLGRSGGRSSRHGGTCVPRRQRAGPNAAPTPASTSCPRQWAMARHSSRRHGGRAS